MNLQLTNNSFKLSLNKINVINDTSLSKEAAEVDRFVQSNEDQQMIDEDTTDAKLTINHDYEIYELLGYLKFNLTFMSETNYVYFQLLNEFPNPQVLEPVGVFLKLITKPEYVSLTFNDFYFDERNKKLIFRPSIVPCYSYEFDYEDNKSFVDMIELLAFSSEKLGYLTLRHLELDLEDYCFLENEKYKLALDDPSNVYDDDEGDYVLGGNNYVYDPPVGGDTLRDDVNEACEAGDEPSFLNSSQASISLLRV